jgi:succinyl-CoA synthetase beta subunit
VRLYEHEGKALLASAGIATPAGALWPVADGDLPDLPVVVKAQLPDGGRGKRGGVRFAGTWAEVGTAAAELLAGSERLPPADAVLVEERVAIARELYLAFAVDRRAATGVGLIAVRDGGVDVEEHARRDATRVALNPLRPLPAFVAPRVARAWEIDDVAAVDTLLADLWDLFVAADCLLLEINPLAVDAGGRFVAVDARVEVDDAARFRHPEWPARAYGTALEAQCAALGANATELAGDVAVLTSGAGLGMATLDLITDAGASAACVVDLGGAVFRPEGVVSEVVRLVCEMRPRALLVNCLLQLASFDALAAEVAAGLRAAGFGEALVVRCAPDHRAIAERALEEFAPLVLDDLGAACRAVATPVPATPAGR